MLRKIISLNKQASNWLAETYPNVFGGEEIRFNDLDQNIQYNILPGSRILELGGADRPLLELSNEYELTGLDVDGYKGQAKEKYNAFIIQSVEQAFPGQYDLIYSATLVEHIRDNTAAFTNIFNALSLGGTTIHYFPSKNCCYALILRLVGHKWQKRLIQMLRPESGATTGYEAFFDKCTVSQIRNLLSKIGFEHIIIKPYYRANSYFDFFLPAFIAVSMFENMCSRLNLTTFATGIKVQAQRYTK